MATEIERLIVRLEATQAKFDRQMGQAAQSANRAAYRIENRFKAMNGSIAASFSKIGSFAILGTLGNGFMRLAEQGTRLQNALRVAGLEGSALTKVYDGLFAAAQRNGTSLEGLVQLYSRVALVQRELGISQEQLVGFTDKVALALRVAGTDAQAASGALLQLSQALGSGVVRAEEFNSILEGAPTIAQAAAAGLKEAGGSVAKLRTLVIEGKVSSEAFFRAFEAGAVTLEAKAAKSTMTLSQEIVRLGNNLLKASTDIDEASGANALMVRMIGLAADAVANFDASSFVSEIGDIIDWASKAHGSLAAFGESLRAYGARIGAALGTDKIGPALDRYGQVLNGFADTSSGGTKSHSTYRRDRLDVTYAEPSPDRFGEPAAKPSTVSLADFKVPSSGRGSRGSKKENDYVQETRTIQERVSALQAEAQALSGINPLAAVYQMQINKARIARELLAAAEKAGVALTPQVRENINALADSYAKAEDTVNKLRAAQEAQQQAAEDAAAFQKDLFGGFIRDMMEGKSAAEALAGALQKVADRLLNDVLDAIFQVKGAGGPLGFLSGLFGGGGGLFPAAPIGGGPLLSGLYHSGGTAGQPTQRRAVHPGVFANAPRYHEGGIAGLKPGEVPAILQHGERVLTEAQQRQASLGGGRVEIVLSPELEARILDRAAGDAVKIVKAGGRGLVAGEAQRAPGAAAEARRRGYGG